MVPPQRRDIIEIQSWFETLSSIDVKPRNTRGSEDGEESHRASCRMSRKVL
ncbi:MAG: hypothetical protein XE10_1488 [Methanoculleus marisnigri]|jgi:hypothetical protein|uniref:Uncharacterized protein n=1 Tax=Methanoculleus marisnigri TaxID=2198 RepID=A0A117LQA6_9EURY|nr:hypothetical protein [Methanoculleus marisnigri]KUK61542.1 MAG: hypothetical protein XD82_1060 [Methanoculleus marisnigri]KUL00273.1 MAG: hypothetical protein XE10_1488 [Methanoculleus marisnigri]